jgi:hypothetical protein
MRQCLFCQKPTEDWLNYCSTDCQISEAKAMGGIFHSPNGLPVGCIRADGNMFEHEHGDHPDYKFPVTCEFIGNKEEYDGRTSECHALIYADESIALTLYECCYAMWYLYTGKVAGGSLWKKDEWNLTSESIKKIRESVTK